MTRGMTLDTQGWRQMPCAKSSAEGGGPARIHQAVAEATRIDGPQRGEDRCRGPRQRLYATRHQREGSYATEALRNKGTRRWMTCDNPERRGRGYTQKGGQRGEDSRLERAAAEAIRNNGAQMEGRLVGIPSADLLRGVLLRPSKAVWLSQLGAELFKQPVYWRWQREDADAVQCRGSQSRLPRSTRTCNMDNNDVEDADACWHSALVF